MTARRIAQQLEYEIPSTGKIIFLEKGCLSFVTLVSYEISNKIIKPTNLELLQQCLNITT